MGLQSDSISSRWASRPLVAATPTNDQGTSKDSSNQTFVKGVTHAHETLDTLEVTQRTMRPFQTALRLARGGRAAAELVGHGKAHEPDEWTVRFDRAVDQACLHAGRAIAAPIRVLPGGEAAVQGFKSVVTMPARLSREAGRQIDLSLQQTRYAKTIRVAGFTDRFMETLGGRIPLIGAVAGAGLGALDVREAWKTLRDPAIGKREKTIVGAQGALSGASGVLGLTGLGVAGAAALGVSAPVTVPVLMTAAAITGFGAFALSLMHPQR